MFESCSVSLEKGGFIIQCLLKSHHFKKKMNINKKD